MRCSLLPRWNKLIKRKGSHFFSAFLTQSNCVFYETYYYVCFFSIMCKTFYNSYFHFIWQQVLCVCLCFFSFYLYFLYVFLSFCDLCVLCLLILKIKKEKKCLKCILDITFQCYGWHLSLIQLSFVSYLNTKHYWYILMKSCNDAVLL